MINYEIIFAYLDDAKKAYQEEKWEEFKVALRKAQNSIGELMQTLDFSYDISRNLYRIYVFCRDSLAAAMYKRSLTEIENAEKMLVEIYQGFINRRMELFKTALPEYVVEPPVADQVQAVNLTEPPVSEQK